MAKKSKDKSKEILSKQDIVKENPIDDLQKENHPILDGESVTKSSSKGAKSIKTLSKEKTPIKERKKASTSKNADHSVLETIDSTPVTESDTGELDAKKVLDEQPITPSQKNEEKEFQEEVEIATNSSQEEYAQTEKTTSANEKLTEELDTEVESIQVESSQETEPKIIAETSDEEKSAEKEEKKPTEKIDTQTLEEIHEEEKLVEELDSQTATEMLGEKESLDKVDTQIDEEISNDEKPIEDLDSQIVEEMLVEEAPIIKTNIQENTENLEIITKEMEDISKELVAEKEDNLREIEKDSLGDEESLVREDDLDINEINGEQPLLEEIERIDGEIEKIEKQMIEELTSNDDADFVPETAEEHSAIKEAEKLEEEAKKYIDEARKLEAEIPPIIEGVDSKIETYIPEFQREEKGELEEEKGPEGEEGEEKGEKEPDTHEEIEEEEEDLKEELNRIYEAGVSSELDEWDREVLLPIFENRLRMSINPIKLSYSKLKNQILSYKGVTHSFQGPMENFRYDKKIVFRFTVRDTQLQLYCDLDPESIDNSVYPHKKTKGQLGKVTPTLLDINDDFSLRNATEIVTLVLAKLGAERKDRHIPKAYAERYPLNPNAVLLGQEKKQPIERQYENDDLYAPISGEIFNGIIEAKFGKEKLEEKKDLKGKELLDDIRQTANTIKASVALTEPIVYFFDAAVNKEGNVEYINIQQVLNDKFLGKIVPQMFFAVAEGSDRIEKFNFLSLAQAVEQANTFKNTRFVLALSCRLLIRDTTFERLLKNAKTEEDNLVLAFDCALLESLGDLGLERIQRLRNEAGTMIMIDNSENAGMRVLTEYDFEYIRFDSRFYGSDSVRQRAHLEMMTGYAKSQNIKTTSINVQTLREAQTLAERGVDVIQGPVASEPKRIVTVAIRGAKKLPLG